MRGLDCQLTSDHKKYSVKHFPMVFFPAVKFSASLLNSFLGAHFFSIMRLPTDACIMEISIDSRGSSLSEFCNLHQESIFTILCLPGWSVSTNPLHHASAFMCVHFCTGVYPLILTTALDYTYFALLFSSLVFFFFFLLSMDLFHPAGSRNRNHNF